MAINFPGFSPSAALSPQVAGMAKPNMGSSLMLQQQLLTQMMGMMQLMFQQFLSSMSGGAVAPNLANFGGASTNDANSGGIGNFLGGSSGSSPASSNGSSASSSAPLTDLSKVEGSEFGKKFAAEAEKTAKRINTPGLCLKGVNDTMQAMGLPVKREASAYMALDDFQNNKRFQEVKVPKDKLGSLPAGAVVIWGKGAGLPHGHISVALGNGKEASSVVRNQLKLNTEYHVFLPK